MSPPTQVSMSLFSTSDMPHRNICVAGVLDNCCHGNKSAVLKRLVTAGIVALCRHDNKKETQSIQYNAI